MQEPFSSPQTGQNSFLLNMQILAETFQEVCENIDFHPANDRPCLRGARIFRKGHPLAEDYVYLVNGCDVDASFSDFREIRFVSAGPPVSCSFHETCPYLILPESIAFLDAFDLVQQVFDKFRNWDHCLQLALNSDYPLDDMLSVSLEIFENPMFIHDSSFYILSCPHYVEGMTQWERDSRTGRQMVPLNLIHDFKADTEYLETLKTTIPAMFSAYQRGYRILYVNLWSEGRYEGRICVDELQTKIHAGDYLALGYLGTFITKALRQRSLFYLNMGNDMDQFFNEYLDGTITDNQRILNYLYFLHWKRNDRYLCLRLDNEQQDINMLSSAATMSHITTQVPTGHTFIYRQSIAVVVNLSYAHTTVTDVLSSLAVLLREGLLKMGASSEINDFFQVPQGYFQASAALSLGRKSASMTWCYRFDDFILEYLLEKGREVIPPELLCSDKLLMLKKYDDKNSTELYRTLKIYLELERNVLQTAKKLFIHRSTLFYRLERIQKIAGVNFEDAKERLVLQLSFYILEQKLET